MGTTIMEHERVSGEVSTEERMRDLRSDYRDFVLSAAELGELPPFEDLRDVLFATGKTLDDFRHGVGKVETRIRAVSDLQEGRPCVRRRHS